MIVQVSATASTNLKIQGVADTAGSATLSIGIQGKNSTARTISAGVTLGDAVGGSDLTNLSNSINAYSAETGVVAVLSADKATVYLTQDEGHDIILTDLDWADVGNDDSHSLQVTGMDSEYLILMVQLSFYRVQQLMFMISCLMMLVVNQLVLQIL